MVLIFSTIFFVNFKLKGMIIMNNGVFIELFGYLGSALVVFSMLMSSVVKLRLINTAGCVISGIYAFISGAIPIVVMNASIMAINIYKLIKDRKKI